MSKTEFRVRPVVRYLVTKYVPNQGNVSSFSGVMGEFANEATAEEVADALSAKYAKHERWVEHIGMEVAYKGVAAADQQTRAMAGTPPFKPHN